MAFLLASETIELHELERVRPMWNPESDLQLLLKKIESTAYFLLGLAVLVGAIRSTYKTINIYSHLIDVEAKIASVEKSKITYYFKTSDKQLIGKTVETSFWNFWTDFRKYYSKGDFLTAYYWEDGPSVVITDENYNTLAYKTVFYFFLAILLFLLTYWSFKTVLKKTYLKNNHSEK